MNRIRSQQGSLLIEALLVIVILSVGLTFIIQSLSSSLRALSFSKNYAQSTFLTDNKFSEILLNKDKVASFQDYGDFEEPFRDYHYKLSTSPISFSSEELSADSMNQINLTVSWQSGTKTRETSSVLCLLVPSDDKDTTKP